MSRLLAFGCFTREARHVEMARLLLRPGQVEVVLSRRNLLTLLSKLDMPGSARTILNRDCYRDGLPVHDVVLIVKADDDDAHYVGRAPAGPVHPFSEAFIVSFDRRRQPGTPADGRGRS